MEHESPGDGLASYKMMDQTRLIDSTEQGFAMLFLLDWTVISGRANERTRLEICRSRRLD